jgi:hypothetical protein
MMTINLSRETPVSYRDAIRRILPTKEGKGLHIGTLHRWRIQGLRGTRLESIKIGGQWYTSLEALQRFFDAVSHGGHAGETSSTTERDNSSAQISSAMHTLRSEGF